MPSSTRAVRRATQRRENLLDGEPLPGKISLRVQPGQRLVLETPGGGGWGTREGAGRDDGKVFVSRGNGETGYEISSAFAKGVIPVGGRGHGLGEIVVRQSYFQEKLSNIFEHPRNMVVGIVSSDTLNENAQVALQDGMVHFVPYNQVQSITVDGNRLVNESRQLVEQLLATVDYPTDGVVADFLA